MHIVARTLKSSVVLAVVLVMVTAALGCAVNPVTGKRELSLISASQEVSMGKQNYQPYQQQQGGTYSVDPELGRYVSEVGQKLAAVSDRTGLPYEFAVINNGVPNAWALPGGKIAINRGLLLQLEDEAQLAAVLAHEVVHAAAKHSVQKIQQDMLLGLTVQAASIAAKDTDYGAALAMGAGVGAGLWTAKYGRDQELQSDAVGMEYMKAAGYDPQAAVELQETFVRLSQQNNKGGGFVEGLFASHPPSQERVNKNREMAAQLGSGGVRNRQQYQRAIAQIKKDQAAYKKHEEAVKAASEGKLDTALSLIETAVKQQPEEALFHATQGQILLAKDLESRAASAFAKSASINPDFYLGHLGLGLIQKKQKQIEQSKQHLLKSLELLPTQTAVYHLGEIELSQGNKQAAIAYFNAAAGQGGELGKKAQSHLDTLQPPTTQPAS